MMSKANVKPGMHSLEPSAGDGRLASSMRAAGLEPDVIEIQSCLRDILKLKGFNLVGHDFMEYDLGGYDIICQNPPFEKGQDLAHVQKAYTLLKPGGRLVSVVSNSIEFRQQKKYSLFRDWLKQVKAENIELPDGAFLESPERPCAVKTRLLVIDKPM